MWVLFGLAHIKFKGFPTCGYSQCDIKAHHQTFYNVPGKVSEQFIKNFLFHVQYTIFRLDIQFLFVFFFLGHHLNVPVKDAVVNGSLDRHYELLYLLLHWVVLHVH